MHSDIKGINTINRHMAIELGPKGASPTIRRAPPGEVISKTASPPQSPEVTAHEERQDEVSRTRDLYSSLEELVKSATTIPSGRLKTTTELAQAPSVIRNLLRGLRMIDRSRRSDSHPVELFDGDEEIKSAFYQDTIEPEAGEPIPLYIFDVSWKNRDRSVTLNHISVQIYENPNASIIHAIDIHSKRRFLGLKGAQKKQVGSLSLPVQREIAEGFAALFNPRLPTPQR